MGKIKISRKNYSSNQIYLYTVSQFLNIYTHTHCFFSLFHQSSKEAYNDLLSYSFSPFPLPSFFCNSISVLLLGKLLFVTYEGQKVTSFLKTSSFLHFEFLVENVLNTLTEPIQILHLFLQSEGPNTFHLLPEKAGFLKSLVITVRFLPENNCSKKIPFLSQKYPFLSEAPSILAESSFCLAGFPFIRWRGQILLFKIVWVNIETIIS